MTYTVRAHDAVETVLAEYVGMSEALDVHEAAGGHATIYDDDDGKPACMAEFGNMGACECHRCNKCEECGGALTPLDDMTVQCVPCCKELGCYEKPNDAD